MDNNNFDSKKVIQMVAIIGILCLFVGIATRIRQNGQKTLADYESPSKTNISESGTTATTPNDSDSDTDTDFNDRRNVLLKQEEKSGKLQRFSGTLYGWSGGI